MIYFQSSFPQNKLYLIFITYALLILGCSESPYLNDTQDVEKSRPWTNDTFSQNNPMSDAFFQDHTALTIEGIQAFFESSPYGRSWLADHRFNGKKASTIVYEQAKNYRLNPILLLSRLQVESSLVSASGKPAQHLIDRAMGCACPDGYACSSSTLGFEKQVRCGAEKFRELYDLSASGQGWWKKGLGKSTLDHYWITPASHASAALYAYTPWVLIGSGGTWLAWKTANLFDLHVYENNLDRIGGGGSSSSSSSSSCGSFQDVSPSHPGFKAIQISTEQAWVSGCGNGTFCPEKSLTRAEAASILVKALQLSGRSSSSFSDIQGHWAKSAIETLVAENIISGCDEDLFCPDEPLTRAQAAVILAKAGHVNGGWHRHSFQDVADDHWASPYISALDSKGYIGGCSANEFCLDAPMRRWIFLVWLTNVMQAPEPSCN